MIAPSFTPGAFFYNKPTSRAIEDTALGPSASDLYCTFWISKKVKDWVAKYHTLEPTMKYWYTRGHSFVSKIFPQAIPSGRYGDTMLQPQEGK
jgi:hypothetical protein